MSYRESLKKSCQAISAKDLSKAPFSVFDGLSNDQVEKMEEVFGIGTVKDLSELKAFQQAKEILAHAKAPEEVQP